MPMAKSSSFSAPARVPSPQLIRVRASCAVVAVGRQGHRHGGGVEQGAGHRTDGEPLEQPGAGGPDDQDVRPELLGGLDQRLGVGVAAADVRLGGDVGRNEGQGLVEPFACLLVQEGLETGLGCMGRAELLDFGHHQHEIQAGTAAAGQRDGQIDGIVASGIG